MTITPYQVLPCYMKATGSSKWQLLKLGNTVPIKPGDTCSLLSDKCWFKIVCVDDMTEQNREHTSKRTAEQDENEFCVPVKKSCREPREEHNTQSSNHVLSERPSKHSTEQETEKQENNTIDNNVSNIDNAYDNTPSTAASCGSSVYEDKTLESNSELMLESRSTNQTPTLEEDGRADANININRMIDAAYANKEVIKDAKGNLDAHISNHNGPPVALQAVQSNIALQINEPSASTASTAANPRRDKCTYGSKCYRKNPHHEAKFSHPGDADYDIPDNREECEYGIRCYRKNPQHRTRFKHTMNIKHPKRTKAQVVVDSPSPTEGWSSDESFVESVDESEYEPTSDVESSGDEIDFDKDDSEWDETTG